MSDPYESWQEEKQSAWLYRVVAECERGTTREALFNELAQAADDQAEIWLAAIMQRAGNRPPRSGPICARASSPPSPADSSRVPCAACWRR